MHCVSILRITVSDSFGHTCADWWPISGNAASSSVFLMVATANVCHCVYVQQCRSSRVCAAMQHASGSLGRPACHSGRETTSGSAEQPHHWQSNPPDYMESRGWSDVTPHYWSAAEWIEWENPGLELSGLPGCAERWLASHPLETRKDAGYSASGIFHHRYREDQLASTAIPSLGGYGVAELEPFESQERGFKHGHRNKYAIPKSNEREIIEEFKKHNGTGLHNLLQDLKISAEESLEPSSAARPALHDETETKEKSAASDIVSTLAVDAFEEGMITAAAIMSQFVHEILLNLQPQCLLTLSAGSHAVHRYATCDDVRWESFMEVSQQIGLQSWITAFE